VAALSLATVALLVVTAAALAVTGDLTQPAGTGGCVSDTGAGTCADGHGLAGPQDVAVSPDGKSVYVAVGSSDAVARFTRNTTTGSISQPSGTAGCVSETGAGPCGDGHALDTPLGVAVSPDKKSVYVASANSSAVARFNRNTTTGAISQPSGTAGCVSETGSGPCADGHGLGSSVGVTVSPDGKSVYAVSIFNGGAVARLNRTTTGAISQPSGTGGCINETGAGSCADGHALLSPEGVAVSPDGKSVYVASLGSDAVVRLNRTTTGAISQPSGTAGCVSDTGAGPCAGGHGLDGPSGVAVSPDRKSVYAAAGNGDAVARLNRNTTTGSITQPAGITGCISETGAGSCADGHALDGPVAVAVSPNGRSVYAASVLSNAVARFNRAP
jgi:DNA-binding beta-propeller fold protein YncE